MYLAGFLWISLALFGNSPPGEGLRLCAFLAGAFFLAVAPMGYGVYVARKYIVG